MFTRNVLGPIMTTAAILALSCLAVGQTMGGGGMSPGMPMPGMPTAPTVPGMHTASGMNGAAVAGAMGGVAAGAGVFYLIHRNHATLLSCSVSPQTYNRCRVPSESELESSDFLLISAADAKSNCLRCEHSCVPGRAKLHASVARARTLAPGCSGKTSKVETPEQ
jgi:hypothetical protein